MPRLRACLLLVLGVLAVTVAGAASDPLLPEGEHFPDSEILLAGISRQSEVLTVAWSGDGNTLATGTSNGTIHLWSVTTGREIGRLEGHEAEVRKVAWSGTTLASAADDGTVRLWDTTIGRQIRTFEGHSQGANAVAWSPDGKILAAGSPGNTLRLWDAATGDVIRRFASGTSDVNTLEFSPDGKILAAGSSDSYLRLWDVATGEERRCEGHETAINAVDWNYDGSLLASASSDRTVRLWDPATNRETGKLEALSIVLSAAFNPGGKILAAGAPEHGVWLWDVGSSSVSRRLEGHTATIYDVAWSGDGKLLASASADQTVRIWDSATGTEIRRLEGHRSAVNAAAWSPGGDVLAAASSDRILRLWDAATGRVLGYFEGHRSAVNAVAWSPDGTALASASTDRTVRLWELREDSRSQRLEGHTGAVNAVTWSPDGTVLASASADRTVRLWDTATGAEIRRLEGPGLFWAVAWSGDGNILAASSSDASVHLWETASGSEVHRLRGHSATVFAVAWDPKGGTLASASADGTIRLWDTAAGSQIRLLERSSSGILSMAWSSDGEFLLSGSEDGTLRLLEATTGRPLSQLTGHESRILGVTFAPGGRDFASASGDGTLRLWSRSAAESAPPLLSRIFVGGRSENWISCTSGGRCLRWDDGSLLLRPEQGSSGQLQPVLPSRGGGVLEILATPAELTADDGAAAPFTLRIRNRSDEPAFWIAVRRVGHEDPDPLVFHPPRDRPVVPVLEPGDEADLRCAVSVRSDYADPREHQASLELEIVSAHGSPLPVAPITVRGRTPVLQWEEARWSREGRQPGITVSVTNRGEQDLARTEFTAELSGLALVQSNIQPIAAGDSVTMFFALPDDTQPEETSGVTLRGRTLEPPIHTWEFRDRQVLKPIPWTLCLSLPALLFLVSVATLAVVRHPLVIALSARPETIRHRLAGELRTARRLLTLSGRLGSVLNRAGVDRVWLGDAISFHGESDPAVRCRLLANRLSLRPEGFEDDPRLWVLPLGPTFPLNLSRCLLYLPGTERPTADILHDLRTRSETFDEVTLLVSTDTSRQGELHRRTSERGTLWVAPSEAELTGLLLASDPLHRLARLIAATVPRTRISPYQTGGGVDKEAAFFGRRRILAHILHRDRTNYLVVGGRQIGKSSLLKAIERWYRYQPQVLCDYVVLAGRELIGSLSTLLDLPRDTGLDAIVAHLEGTVSHRRLLLIDEADAFIREERETGYPVLGRLRSLAEKGRCHFILAGFWDLYAAAVDYQSPLRNFGEILQINALEEDACRELAVEPMKTMGLSYASDEIVDRLVARTGRRANLIALTCQEILRQLDPDEVVIGEAEVSRALASSPVDRALSGWETLTGDDANDRLDRILVYATIGHESFTLPGVLDTLADFGITASPEEVRRSLDRLDLAFVIQRRGSDYAYSVPLLHDQIGKRDPAAMLAHELEGHQPLVARLVERPAALRELPPEELRRAARLLRGTGRLDQSLRAAEIRESWLEGALVFHETADPDIRCRRLAERLGLQPEGPEAEDPPLWILPLGATFPLSLARLPLCFPSVDDGAADVYNALCARPDTFDHVTMVVSADTPQQAALRQLAGKDGRPWVIPTQRELTDLLLSSDPWTTLARLIASQVPYRRISPYQISGGVDKESIFFGRRELLAHVLDRPPANYLLVGGRQVGKSSLLKAIERRCRNMPLRCHYIVLGSSLSPLSEFGHRLAATFGLPGACGLEAAVDHLARGSESEQRLILVDEADAFCRADREGGHRVFWRLRSLSEESRCHFIFAGFWSLYAAAVLDHQSPARNFGETLTIGALEPEACRELAREPMVTLGLDYASPKLVEQLIEPTGGRADLIVIACNEILKGLDPETRTIDSLAVERALASRAIERALDSWHNLGAIAEADSRLDRIVIYATVSRGPFTQAKLHEILERLELPVDPERLKHSLERLELALVLRRDEAKYAFQVPLLVAKIRMRQPEALLRRELRKARARRS